MGMCYDDDMFEGAPLLRDYSKREVDLKMRIGCLQWAGPDSIDGLRLLEERKKELLLLQYKIANVQLVG